MCRWRWQRPPWTPASRASRSPTWTPTAKACARGATRWPAYCSGCSSGCAVRPSASRSPRAKRSRGSVLPRGHAVLVADTAISEMPKANELADIAVEAAGVARRMGYEPRLAMLAFSTFGHPPGERSAHVIEAVKILDSRRVDFQYDGEMSADVALNPAAAAPYPFNRLTGPANVLIMA